MTETRKSNLPSSSRHCWHNNHHKASMSTVLFFITLVCLYSAQTIDSFLVKSSKTVTVDTHNEHAKTIDQDQSPFHPIATIKLLTDPVDLDVNVGDIGTFTVHLTSPPLHPISVGFICKSVTSQCSTFDGEIEPIVLTKDNYTMTVEFLVMQPGHDEIKASIIHNKSLYIDEQNAYVRIRAGRGKFWYYLSIFFGWAYFVSWSVSFWPQNFTNYKRKSVVGLSFDYSILHFTGFLFYSIFNTILFASPLVQTEYEQKYPHSEIPVQLNDVVYSLHAALATGITWTQCFIYEKGDQRLSLFSKLFQYTVWGVGGVLMLLAVIKVVTWLTFIYFFSYIKLLVTAIKYMPQVWYNFRRKSTAGWTIKMIYLDICGGSLSMFQMLVIAYNYNDWTTLVGNLPKFGLAMASVFYDIIFFLQHFVFYRHNNSVALEKRRSTLKDSGDSRDQLCSLDSNSSLSSLGSLTKSAGDVSLPVAAVKAIDNTINELSEYGKTTEFYNSTVSVTDQYHYDQLNNNDQTELETEEYLKQKF